MPNSWVRTGCMGVRAQPMHKVRPMRPLLVPLPPPGATPHHVDLPASHDDGCPDAPHGREEGPIARHTRRPLIPPGTSPRLRTLHRASPPPRPPPHRRIPRPPLLGTTPQPYRLSHRIIPILLLFLLLQYDHLQYGELSYPHNQLSSHA